MLRLLKKRLPMYRHLLIKVWIDWAHPYSDNKVNRDLMVKPMSGFLLQMATCLNDVRQDPLKYKFYYPCHFDKDVAPKLSGMKGGRRLPLTGTSTITADLLDRLIGVRTDIQELSDTLVAR